MFANSPRGWIPALVLLAGGCRNELPTPDPNAAFLVDGAHQPDVLVESAEIEFPPSLSGNRFLRGWWPWRDRGQLRMVVHDQAALLEIVSLEARPRRLLWQTLLVEGDPEGTLQTSWDDQALPERPLSTPGIDLPPSQRQGRVVLKVEVPAETQLAVEQAQLDRHLPAGKAEFDLHDVRQSGYSVVEFVRPVSGTTRLVGAFFPPEQPDPNQHFEIALRYSDGSTETVWEWQRGGWGRRKTALAIDLPIRTEGFVGIQLVARGTGPPATWSALALNEAVKTAPEEALPTPEPPPTVVVYVLDALRADYVEHLGRLGDGSPFLDRLASQGVTFLDHLAPAPNTLPSTKALFTGQVFVEQGMADLPPADEGPATLAELYSQAGYRSGLFTGNGYVYYQATRGFDHVEDSCLYTNYESSFNDNAERVHEAALDWVERQPSDTPLFLYLHTVNPHNPYEPPRDLEQRFASSSTSTISGDTETLLGIKRGRVPIDDADRARLLGLYQGGVTYNDRELGRFLTALEERVGGEVLLFLTSDHGEELFDHGGLLHGYSLQREQLHIPLIAWWRNTLAPGRVHEPTTTLDLYATLRRLVDPDGPPPPGARSLWPQLLDGQPLPALPVRFAAASGVRGGIFSAESETGKWIWAPRTGAGWGLGEGLGRTRDPEYFFDLLSDPGESNNRAGEGSLEAAWLRSRLLAWREQQLALEQGSLPAAPISDEQRKNLEALGYVN